MQCTLVKVYVYNAVQIQVGFQGQGQFTYTEVWAFILHPPYSKNGLQKKSPIEKKASKLLAV